MTKQPIHPMVKDQAVWECVDGVVQGTRMGSYSTQDSELKWAHSWVAVATLYDNEGLFLGIVTARWDDDADKIKCNVVFTY